MNGNIPGRYALSNRPIGVYFKKRWRSPMPRDPIAISQRNEHNIPLNVNLSHNLYAEVTR